MPLFSSSILSLSILTAGYFSAVCTTSPNPHRDSNIRKNSSKTDHVRFITGTVATTITRIVTLISLYHALVTLFYPRDENENYTHLLPRICPHPENLKEEVFTWSPIVITSLLAVALGSIIRISAFGGLGQNFTFHLAAPDRLVMDGVYQFMQHPSYTGIVLVGLGCVGLFCRWDAAVGACWMDQEMLELLKGWGEIVLVASVIVGVGLIMVRVRDEETVLREKFGQEWEVWHGKTARFVPGII